MSQRSEREGRLEQVLADYLRSVEAGQSLDPASLVRQHPELADELRSFFRNRAAMEQLAQPLRAEDTPTFGWRGAEIADGLTHIRYFGDYELLEEIARGGMGVIYKARQVTLNRVVAIKMILAGHLASGEEVQRFRQEAEAAANLDHPHIVPIYEVGEHNGQHYFSMGFIEGQSLAQQMAEGPLEPREAAELVLTIALAVQYAHERGVVHRDLKPANVLVDRSGRPRVTDFGLAKRASDESNLTATGQVLGTPSYMPPEQAAGRIDLVGPASDVYALGAILYALLSGRPPFQAASSLDTLKQVLESEPVALRALDPGIPRDLETMALKCLEKSIPRRYGSAHELGEELERFLQGRPILARPVGRLERSWRWAKRNPWVASLSATVTCLLIAAALGSTLAAIVINRERRTAVAAGEQEKVQRLKADQQRERAEREQKRAAREEQRAKDEADRAIRHLYLAHINLAQQAWEETALARLEELLELTLPENTGGHDLRGLEWHYWNRLLHRYQVSTRAHEGAVMSMTYSPDGKYLATSGADGWIYLWDPAKGEQVRTLGRHQETPGPLAFNSDGTLLVSGGGDRQGTVGEVIVWDVEGGQEKFRLEGHHSLVTGVAFSPDGQQIASGSLDQTAYVWDVASRERKHSFTDLKYGVSSLAISPNGTYLAIGTRDRWIRVYNLASGEVVHTQHGFDDWVTRVVFSPDSKLVAGGSLDRTVRVLDAEKGTLAFVLPGHAWAIVDVAFSADGSRIVTGSHDQTIRAWSADKGRPQFTLRAHRDGVTRIAISPNGKQIASGSGGGTLRLWDAAPVQDPVTLPAGGSAGGIGVWGAAFSPDGKLLAASAGEGKGTYRDKFHIWKWPSGELAHTIKAQSWVVSQVQFSPDSSSVATVERILFFRDRPCSVCVWNAESGQLRFELRHPQMVYQAVFNPQGGQLATACQDGNIRLWNAADGPQPRVIEGGVGPVMDVAYSSDGQLVAGGGDGPVVKVWNCMTGAHVVDLPLQADSVAVLGLSIDYQGRKVAAACADNIVRLWNLADGKLTHVLRGHANAVYDVAFSPNDDRLVSSSADGTVKVWDPDSGQVVLTLRGHKRDVPTVSFHPDGWQIASASFDTTVKVWNATPELIERQVPDKSRAAINSR